MASTFRETLCIITIVLVAAATRSMGQQAVQLPENVQQVIMSALPNIEQHVQNLTARMEILLGNVAHLLQSQLDILSERLPPPPATVPTAPPPPPTPPPMDCQDIAAQGPHVSGPYTITPRDDLGPFQVYCDMDTDGGGWTVFQQRFDGSVDFFKGWDEYEYGFGSCSLNGSCNLDGEYWLGLQRIRRLVQTGEWTLRIDLGDFEGNKAYAEYELFSVGDAASYYQLSIGAYSGTAGDSLRYHNNLGFTTKDADHDTSDRNEGNCAISYKGGWWYGDCQNSNLNGLWLEGQGTIRGMVWYKWRGPTVLKTSQMKIRRVQ